MTAASASVAPAAAVSATAPASVSAASAATGSVTWREPRSTDIETLVALDAQLFAGHAWSAQTWWEEFAQRPRRDYLVGERHGQIVAYGGLDIAGETADVMTVAVAPSAQGRGLGALVLAVLEHRARERGTSAGLLEVRADNAAAVALYAAAGWRQLHRRRGYYQPEGVDALILGKTWGSDHA